MPETAAPNISDTAVYVVSSICLALIVALAVYVASRLIFTTGKGRLRFLRGFRNGQFAMIYFIAVPMAVVAFLYSGENFGGSLLRGIAFCVELVVLKFDYDAFAPLMESNVYFCVVAVLMYVVTVINAALFTFAIAGKYFTNRIRLRRSVRSGRHLYVIVGYNAANAAILSSVGSRGNAIVLADLTSDEKDEVMLAGKCHMRMTADDDPALIFAKMRREGKLTDVIVNTGSDEKNLIFLERICSYFDMCAKKGLKTRALRFRVHTFGDPVSVSEYLRFEEKLKGVIRYVGKYRLIAMDFIDRYPVTRFMTDEIDAERGGIKPDVDVNVTYIGFGRTNLRLFLTSVENDQLMTVAEDGGYAPKPVSYWIFDKKDSEGEKNLNHNYHRYANEVRAGSFDGGDYFELPPFPANTEPTGEHFIKEDINSRQFYLDLRARLKAKDGRRAYNYVVVAIGTDMENLDLAEKIAAKLREWKMNGYTRVFVKIRSGSLARGVLFSDPDISSSLFVFGVEDEVIYDVGRITRERTEAMAMRRHVRYTELADPNAMTEEEIVAQAQDMWYTRWKQVQRESNAYACLALRMKLNMLGFDYVPADSDLPDRSAEYAAKYFAGDEPVRNANGLVDYGDCEFKTGTVRSGFAMQEHQRWNAYMICNGYVPASKRETAELSRDDRFDLRVHANITTYDGLLEYRKFMSEVCKAGSVADCDVIKYDYQIMDYAAELLAVCGYKITDKAEADKLYNR